MTAYGLVSDVAPAGLYLLKPEESPIRIGRESKCAVFLPHPAVSRRHAQLRWEGGHFLLEDLGSSNGTRVNGESVGPGGPLRANDVVEVGPFAFRFRTFVDVSQALEEAESDWPIPLAPENAAADDGFEPFRGGDLLAIAYRLHYGAKTGVVRVRTQDGRMGSVEFLGGDFGGASFGEREGLDAVKELFKIPSGSMRFEAKEPQPGRAVLLPGGELLMQVHMDQAGSASTGQTIVQESSDF